VAWKYENKKIDSELEAIEVEHMDLEELWVTYK